MINDHYPWDFVEDFRFGSAAISVMGGLQRSRAGPLLMWRRSARGWGVSLASFLRFWAAAANRTLSLAHLGPRSRSRICVLQQVLSQRPRGLESL